jgi:hypothetical protein
MQYIIYFAAAVVIIWLLRKVSIQNAKIDELYNKEAYRRYMNEIIVSHYERMIDEFMDDEEAKQLRDLQK